MAANAALVNWVGPLTGGSAANAANWSTNPAFPQPGDDIHFPAGMNGTVTLDAPTVAGLSFTLDGAGSLTISGNPDTNTFQATGSPAVFNIASGGSVTFNCRVASSSMTKSGAGTLSLTNTANTITGTVNIAGGTLQVGANGAANAIGASAVNVTGAATLDITRSYVSGGLIAKYYQLPGGPDSNQFNALSTLNTYLAGFTQATLGAPNAGQTTCLATTINYTLGGGYGGGSPFSGDGFGGADNIVGYWSGKINIATAGNTTFYTTSDDGSMIFIDGNTVVNNNFFQGATTRSGSTNLTAGLHDITVAFYEGGGGAGINAGFGAANNNPFPPSSLFSTTAPAATTFANAITLGAPLTVTGETTMSLTMSGAISGGNALTLSNAANFTLSNNANNFTGQVTLRSGNLSATTNNSLGTAAGGLRLFGGTTLDLSNGVTLGDVISLVGDATIRTAAGSSTLSGNIDLVGRSIVFAGGGTTNVNGAVVDPAGNTGGMVGGLREGRIVSGGLDIGTPNPNNGGNFAGNPIVTFPRVGQTDNEDGNLAAGHWGNAAPYETWIYTGQFFDADGIFAMAENVDDDCFISIDGVNRLLNNTWNQITTTGSNAGNTFGGTTNFGMGPNGDGWHNVEIRFATSQGGGSGANGNPGNGWSNIKGFGINSSNINLTSINAADYPSPVDPGDGTVFRTGAFPGGVNVTAGTVRFAGSNTYTGRTTVSGGNLQLAGGSAIVDANSVTVNFGGTMTVQATETMAQIAGSGNVVLNAGTVLRLGNAVDFTASNTISGAGGIEKLGSGRMTLSSFGSTYSGGTTITAGNILATYSAALGTGTITMNGGNLEFGFFSGGLLGQYYSLPPNRAMLNTLTLLDQTTQNIPAVANFVSNVDYSNGGGGGGAPFTAAGFNPTDNILVRWSGKIMLPAGVTTFFTTSDDGSCVWIDDDAGNLQNSPVVNNNFFQGMTTRQGNTPNYSTARMHSVVVAFYEGGGGAGMFWEYQPPAGVRQIVPANILFPATTSPGNVMTGQYYNIAANPQGQTALNSFANLNAILNPLTPQITAPSGVSFPNGDDGPNIYTGNQPFSSVGYFDNDDMVCRWTGQIFLPAGQTRFYTTSDDGSCVWIDNDAGTMIDAPLVNNNFFQGATTRFGDTVSYSTARLHTVVVAFYEGGGGAGVVAEYETFPIGSGSRRTILHTTVNYPDPTVINVANAIVVNAAVSGSISPSVVGTQLTLSGAITGNAGSNLTFSNGSGQTMTVSGNIAGTGNFLKTGADLVVFSGSNLYSGTTTITNGVLRVTGTGIGDSSRTIIGATGVLNLTGTETIGALEGVPGSSITLGANNLLADGGANPFNGVISGTGGLTKQGSGTLTLGGVNTYSGATFVTLGTLTLGTSNVLPDASAVSVTNGAILNLGASNDTVASFTLVNGTLSGSTGVLTSTAVANVQLGTVTGRIGGPGLSKTTAGTVTMSGANTYAGNTTVTAGTLVANGGGTIPDTSTVDMAGGSLTVGGNETVGALTGSTNISIGSNTLTVGSNNGSFGYSGSISGPGGSLTKIGTGTQTLTGGNSFDGTVTVSVGGLALGAGALSFNVDVVVNGGTLTVNGPNDVLSLLLQSGLVDGASTLSCDDITLESGTVSCNLDGFGGILKDTAAGVTLSGNNVYFGDTVIDAGTLTLAGGNAIPDDSEVYFADAANAVLNLNSVNETVGGLADGGPLGGNVTLGTATLTINPFIDDYFGVISGIGGSIDVIGGGFQSLNGTNTYSGTTTITDGTLEVNGSINSATTVGADGILAGTGTINGTVTVQAGGTVEPGSGAVGTLTTGSVDFQANSNLDITVDGVGGSNTLAVTVAGTVSIASTSIINTFGIAPLPDTQGYLVISNDGTDPITGPIFSGSGNGSVIGIVDPNNGHIFFSGPNAGSDGNDVVLLPNRNPVSVAGNGPYTFDEGDTLTHILNGSASDPDGDALTYTWTYNNPALVTLVGQNATFPELNGTNVYNVTLTVTDPLNGSVVADGGSPTVVTINNVAPSNLVLAFSPSANPVVDEGSTFEVSGTFSDPGTLDAHTVVIDWGDGDTTFVNLAANDLSFPPTAHVYANDIVVGVNQSPYVLTVTIVDDGATPVSDGTSVTVNDVAPHLILTAHYQGPEEALVNPYVMTILANTDPGSDTITQYTIHWGDGVDEVVNGPILLPASFNHVYTDAPALHLITIDGVDENGTHLVIGKIDPNDQPKFGSEFLLVEANLGESFSYNLVTDGGMTGDPTPVLTILGGLAEITNCGITFSGTTFSSPSLLQAGAFTVLIKAENFIKTNYINLIIVVKKSGGGNTPRVLSKAVAVPNPVQAGKSVEFSVVATDEDGDQLSYFWDFGDGTSNANENRKPVTTHTYAAAGNYVVTVVVSDGARTVFNKINMVVTGVANSGSFRIATFKLSFDFRTPAKSSLITTGTVKVPASLVIPGSDINVSIPGTTYDQTFHMNASGIGGDTTSQLTMKVSVPGATESIAKFTMHLKGVDAGGTKLFDRLTPLGYLNKKIGRPGEEIFFPLQVKAPAASTGEITTIITVYTCVPNKLGKAVLKK